MWNFKPNEKQPEPPIDTINHNTLFFKNNIIVRPPAINLDHHDPLFVEIKSLWNLIPHWVIKADLGRLMHIYLNGNLYLDVDCYIIKNILNKNNDDDGKAILFTEKIANNVNCLGPRECKNPENVLRVANYAFGSNVKQHPFFRTVIEECLVRLKKLIFNFNKITQEDILWVCGPDVITSVYHKYSNKNEIHLFDNTYLKHYCLGSWR